ncbi:MAG TPA: hypothetical protein VIL34_05605 [Actinopolymorphaceae bacterium]|jgi:hypothetical protein
MERHDPPIPDPDGTNRWTKEGVTPGEDPREIDEEQFDPRLVHRVQQYRAVVHAEEATDPAEEMGTTATSHDPTERD